MAIPPPVHRTRRVAQAQNRPAPAPPGPGANRDVAERLRQAVRAAGGNLAVARRSGVPLATVNNYVRGRNGMKIEPLAALAAACNVSLDWLVSPGETSVPLLPAIPDYPAAESFTPPGLGEAPADRSPANMPDGVDVRLLTMAIEIVAAIAGPADLHDDPKGLARRVATTYAVLIERDAPQC